MTLATLLSGKRLILASQSPRRKQLLAGLDIPFESIVLESPEELFPEELHSAEIAEYLARAKSDFYVSRLNPDENTIILTADTIVWFNNKVLNKPQSKEDAISMLTQLSGNTHEVYTGVCIYYQNEFHTFSSLSKVEFADLDAEEVEYYVEQYKPYDKAGSYGAQEWIGYVAIKHIDGSFFNVMGLPIRMVYNDLKNILSK